MKLKKMAKVTAILGATVLPLLAMTSVVLGQAPLDDQFNLTPPGQFSNLATLSLPEMVRKLIVLAMVLAAIIAFGFLIYGGIVWITSGGDKAKTETARNTITAALVGLLIVFGSWAIIQLVQMFFDVNIFVLNLDISS